MERETEILASYLALREAIDVRISELKALRALCSPKGAKSGGDGRSTPRSFVPGVLTNGRTREIQDCVNSSAALSVANKLHKLALAGDDQLAIAATAAKVALMQARHDAALARKAAAKLAPVPAVPPVPEAPQIAPPMATAECGSAALENEEIPMAFVVADIAAAFGLSDGPCVTVVPAESLTPEQRFAAAFADGASVSPKPSKAAKIKVPKMALTSRAKMPKSGKKASV